MIDNATPFLDKLFQQYLSLSSIFNHLLCWGWFGENVVGIIIFHKLNLFIGHKLSDLILEILEIFDWVVKDPIMISTFLIWIVSLRECWFYGI